MNMMNLKRVIAVHVLFKSLVSLSCHSADTLVQQQLDRISHLPGQSFDINFSHYSGYVNVAEDSGRNLFYWLTESSESPHSKPLVLWLNGGPGCSSIAFGEAEEIGPFHIQADGKTLYLNPYAWNQAADILFLDSPAWVGYSYSNNKSDEENNGDVKTAEDSLAFLLKWFERFPQYKGRDFFLTGESYAGHYVPQLSQAILKHNSATNDTSINLKGYMVGNALTDDFHDHLGVFQFIWSNGLISDETYRLLNQTCVRESFIHTSFECYEVLINASNEMGNIDPHSIYTPPCPGSTLVSNQLAKHPLIGRITAKYDRCTVARSLVYFNLPEVRDALHVHPSAAQPKWSRCNMVVNENWGDCPSSTLEVYRELIQAGLRIWVFSGDMDAVIPVTATRYSLGALNLKTLSPWQTWVVDGQVAGWVQEYDGLTFVTVRGAGHEVPLHKPKEALTLFKAFLSGKLSGEAYTNT